MTCWFNCANSAGVGSVGGEVVCGSLISSGKFVWVFAWVEELGEVGAAGEGEAPGKAAASFETSFSFSRAFIMSLSTDNACSRAASMAAIRRRSTSLDASVTASKEGEEGGAEEEYFLEKKPCVPVYLAAVLRMERKVDGVEEEEEEEVFGAGSERSGEEGSGGGEFEVGGVGRSRMGGETLLASRFALRAARFAARFSARL